MPKMKTKRAAAKRLKRTASGKLKRAGGWKQHKLERKEPGRRRRLRESKLSTRPTTADEAPRPVSVTSRPRGRRRHRARTQKE